MTTPLTLSNILTWTHRLLGEVLAPGALALDLTAGNGHDTLFLARAVGPQGRVVAFDIQEQALANTAARLASEDFAVHRGVRRDGEGALLPGAHLVAGCHASLKGHLEEAPQAAVANLGYLPGGDHGVTTAVKTTTDALCQAMELLAPGGRLAVVVYTGHPGGAAEGAAVDALFAALDPKGWEVLRMEVPNRLRSPYLLMACKR